MLVLTDNQWYSEIASAIRGIKGVSDTYRPSEMAGAIAAMADVDVFATKTASAIRTNASYVASGAFEAYSLMTEAALPSCVTIGESAFANCTSLSSVSMPLVQTIGDGAFRSCAITSLSLSRCTALGEYALAQNSSLSSLALPQCVDVGSYALASCKALTEIDLPACETLWNYALAGCQSLQAVSLYAVTSMASYALRSCYNLVSVYLHVSAVPSLRASTVFGSTPIGGYSRSAGRYGSIYVPSSLYQDFLTAQYWSALSSRITSM